MSWSKSVFSSNVSEIGFDDDTQELIVVWKSGKTSAYAGVPEAMADEASRAASVGGFLNNMIKNQFPHRYRA